MSNNYGGYPSDSSNPYDNSNPYESSASFGSSAPYGSSDPYGSSATAPMPAPPQGAGQVVGKQKSMVVAALLAFFLGVFGVHNFYVGYTNRGLAQLGMTVASIVLSAVGVAEGLATILSWVVALWVLVEFVLILLRKEPFATDARGVPLR